MLQKKGLDSRLNIVTVIFISSLILLSLRLIKIQLLSGAYLSKLAFQQHYLAKKLSPKRGAIFDRNLKKLAFSTTVNSVYAMTKEIPNKEFVAHQLASILKINEAAILNKLKKGPGFVWIARQVPKGAGVSVARLKLNGVGIFEEDKRVYPNDPMANHTLGFTDIDCNGLEGIELAFDEYLKGRCGWLRTERDARLRPISSFQQKLVPARDGYNIILSIDEMIQYIAERELDTGMKRHKAKAGVVIVMNPKTGDILALANRPRQGRNRALTDAYEPGSCFKIVTAAAALEEKAVGLQDNFYCEQGSYKFGTRLLHDYRPHGDLTFQQVIEKSSNIGTVKVATKLGQDVLYKYIKKFGFGEITGVNLPGEAKGLLKPTDKWSSFSITSIPIGHEVGITPIQLARAISTVANDGVMMKPRLVLEIQDNSGNGVKKFDPVVQRKIFSKDTAEKLKFILKGAVENGTGKAAQVSGYAVAGKTGTAQKTEANGAYSDTKFVGSFVGFVPVDDPVLSIVVLIDEPQPIHLGGAVAAPIFKNIAKDALYYLEVLPDANLVARH